MKDFNIKKLYYSISEVSKITDVEQYVLRFWENVFEQLRPQKNRAGNRIYTNKEIETILFIKSLLRDQKYTIEGAKKVLADQYKGKTPSLEELKREEFQVHDDESDESSLFEADQEKEVSGDKSELYKDLVEIKNFLEILRTKL
ncbi:MAG: MerR family transcriptional regulator [Ignavibacteria bacterium]|nr:MerR family transcriptional regulator [Ignavibacteria bacterium]